MTPVVAISKAALFLISVLGQALRVFGLAFLFILVCVGIILVGMYRGLQRIAGVKKV